MHIQTLDWILHIYIYICVYMCGDYYLLMVDFILVTVSHSLFPSIPSLDVIVLGWGGVV